MPASWDAVSERKLLLSIIELTNPKPPSWALVSEKMGNAFTQEACRQHFQKIKRDSRNNSGGSSGASTPTKTAGVKKTPKSKSAKRKDAAVDDDEDGMMLTSDDNTPSKKPKTEGTQEQSAILFKIEAAGQDGVDLTGDDEIYD